MAQNRSLSVLSAALIAISGFAAARAYAAIAGRPDATDVKVIDTCLADATTAKSDPDACIGHVSSGCVEIAPTTAAKEKCIERELLVWDAALNRDYAQLTELLTDDSVKQALRDAERDFIIAKLGKCTFERIARKDSADALLAAALCNVKATARQDLWLIEQTTYLKPH
jgi:uncharacterized protein YecT (DUF1311 family)